MTEGDGLEEVFRATQLADLPDLVTFLERGCSAVGASPDATAQVHLATEEVFTNILQHGYSGQPGPVTVCLKATAHRVTVVLTDEAPAFDPDGIAAPELTADWDERGLGGLGWHLVHQVMDEVGRETGHRGGNVFTLVKELSARSPRTEDV